MMLIQNGTQGPATVPAKQVAVGTPGYAYGGPPGATPVTRWDPDVANTLLAEMAAVATATGAAINPTNNQQCLLAIQQLAGATVTSVTGTVTLLPLQSGLIEVNGNNAPYTIQLPPAMPWPCVYRFVRTDAGAGVVTIQTRSPSAFTPGGAGTLTLGPGATAIIVCDGGNWAVLQQPDVVRIGAFSNYYPAVNQGYDIRPDGMIEQTVNALVPCSGSGFVTTLVTLPIAFPNTIADAIISYLGNTPPLNVAIAVEPYSKSQVAVTTNSTIAGSVGVVIRAKGK